MHQALIKLIWLTLVCDIIPFHSHGQSRPPLSYYGGSMRSWSGDPPPPLGVGVFSWLCLIHLASVWLAFCLKKKGKSWSENVMLWWDECIVVPTELLEAVGLAFVWSEYVSVSCGGHTGLRNVGFGDGLWEEAKMKEFRLWQVPNFEGIGFKVGPLFGWGVTVRFECRPMTTVLQGLKPLFPIEVGIWWF